MNISSPELLSINQVSVWDEIWNEHMKARWGEFKTFRALKSKGSKASWRMVQEVCDTCEVCVKFRQDRAHAEYGQPPY